MPLIRNCVVAAQPLRSLVAALAAAAVLLATAGAATPAHAAELPEAAEKSAYDVTSWLRVHGRGFGQSHHADYQQRMMPRNLAAVRGARGWERQFWTDPYVAEQGPERTEWREIRFNNRYGAPASTSRRCSRRGSMRTCAARTCARAAERLTRGTSGPRRAAPANETPARRVLSASRFETSQPVSAGRDRSCRPPARGPGRPSE